MCLHKYSQYQVCQHIACASIDICPEMVNGLRAGDCTGHGFLNRFETLEGDGREMCLKCSQVGADDQGRSGPCGIPGHVQAPPLLKEYSKRYAESAAAANCSAFSTGPASVHANLSNEAASLKTTHSRRSALSSSGSSLAFHSTHSSLMEECDDGYMPEIQREFDCASSDISESSVTMDEDEDSGSDASQQSDAPLPSLPQLSESWSFLVDDGGTNSSCSSTFPSFSQTRRPYDTLFRGEDEGLADAKLDALNRSLAGREFVERELPDLGRSGFIPLKESHLYPAVTGSGTASGVTALTPTSAPAILQGQTVRTASRAFHDSVRASADPARVYEHSQFDDQQPRNEFPNRLPIFLNRVSSLEQPVPSESPRHLHNGQSQVYHPQQYVGNSGYPMMNTSQTGFSATYQPAGDMPMPAQPSFPGQSAYPIGEPQQAYWNQPPQPVAAVHNPLQPTQDFSGPSFSGYHDSNRITPHHRRARRSTRRGRIQVQRGGQTTFNESPPRWSQAEEDAVNRWRPQQVLQQPSLLPPQRQQQQQVPHQPNNGYYRNGPSPQRDHRNEPTTTTTAGTYPTQNHSNLLSLRTILQSPIYHTNQDETISPTAKAGYPMRNTAAVIPTAMTGASANESSTETTSTGAATVPAAPTSSDDKSGEGGGNSSRSYSEDYWNGKFFTRGLFPKEAKMPWSWLQE
ncbi:uncharacterized protein BP01DRAFT_378206 [Aspergillus saccharolyticus JOP 1030-1]|uniref:Uncharacterized protein n=1 Tax=Aspergillus saccharolyticus JOP 1030-1 TaxID=1450539 RepID=A0A318ZZ91_9EURO|nr:hypothetical protein BP01DRAFT_378206 [Aspergillus saccharolyticus JOP 1030-1]PYH49593.1 hypothetical protein BP01DRAFT_378206 [Aspergillus saccharolyticus JOP 1030-1]